MPQTENHTGRFNFKQTHRNDFSRIRALCFDVDGTLCDTDDQMVKHLARWLRLVSFWLNKSNAEIAARRIVMSMENPGNFLYGLPDHLHIDHQVDKLADKLYQLRKHKKNPQPLPIIPGVKEMLEHLRSYYPMAVVSARGRRNTLAFLDYYEITSYFRAIATNLTCPHTKPYPDSIVWAAEQMNVLPSQCLMIGDTTVDIRAGKAAGAQTVGVLCGFGEKEELINAGADLILTNTPELVEILPDKSSEGFCFPERNRIRSI
jgi:HAD superfamily hydrolase (TIGR01509 family)